MTDHKTAISVSQLKSLLYELSHSEAHICIRIRLIGQMWQQNFMHVVSFTDDDVLLLNEVTGKFFSVAQFSNIIQFEIDHVYKTFQPLYHYEVVMEATS